MSYARAARSYFTRYDPFTAVVAPILVWMVLLTLGLLAGWEWCRRKQLTRQTASHIAFLAICLAPLGAGALALLSATPPVVSAALKGTWVWALAIAIAAGPIVWAFRQPRRASRLLRSGLLYSWPVLAVILVTAVRENLHYPHSAYAEGPFAAPLPAAPDRPRVVWVIFDELSQTIAFSNRPPGLSLPNLDRLRREGFYATSAYAPAGNTELSLPSLILGQTVQEAASDGPRDLLLKLHAQAGMAPWSSLPNIFDSARELGFNTAVVGWYHPYGRVLSHSLTECYWVSQWEDPAVAQPEQADGFLHSMSARAYEQFLTLPLAGHLPGAPRETFVRREKLAKWALLEKRAREVVSDPKIGLAMIHLPVPHPPAVYDRAHATLTDQLSSYVDDVALVDLELGDVRQAIEKAGLAGRTAIVVSADHGWRTYGWRGSINWTPEDEAQSHQDTSGVPFLVTLPGQTVGTVYTQRLNTVMTRHLITEILSGQLSDPATETAWVESAGGW